MASNSNIEWTKHTGNLWWGCTEVHAGCDNCYARAWDHRYNGDHWGNDKPRRAIKSVWGDFKRWQRAAKEAGEIHNVFVGSMMDIAEKSFPAVDVDGKPVKNANGDPMTTEDLRELFFQVIVPESPNLRFLLLSKRPSNFNKVIPEHWKENPPSNVMFGTSPVNQPTAKNLLPHLLQVKGKRFLSVEPQLGPINLRPWLHRIDWVIVGGESGPGKRPFDPYWARDIREQCKEYNVPFFMKQIDKIRAIPEDLLIKQFPA